MKSEIPSTHKQLARRISHWLQFSRKCNVVATELSTQVQETPDAIGWHGPGYSILVECKMSRADFHADKIKNFRHYEELGMGDERYFATVPGVIVEDDVPDGWGLLVVNENCVRQIKDAVRKKANKQNEVKMLMSIIRRVQISTAVFVREEPTSYGT